MKEVTNYSLDPVIRKIIKRWSFEAGISMSRVVELLVMRVANCHLWRDPSTAEFLFIDAPYKEFIEGKINERP